MGLLYQDDEQLPFWKDRNVLLALGAGLLGAQRGREGEAIGQGLLGGLNLRRQAQMDERANRQNELQQLTASYPILKQQDQVAREMASWNGQPYTPNPLLAQHEARLSKLIGGPSLFGSSGATPSTPQPDPPGLLGRREDSAVPPAVASQYSPAVRPEWQAPGQMPQPQAPQQPPTLRQIAQAANIPEPIAQSLIAQGKSAELYKMAVEALKPHNGPAGVTRINPATGGLEIMGGQASPGQVPFSRDAGGNLVARPIQGAAEEVARAEALKTGAIEQAKAPYSFGNYPIGPNGGAQIASVAELMRRESMARGAPQIGGPQGGPIAPRGEQPAVPARPSPMPSSGPANMQPQYGGGAPQVARLEVTEPSRAMSGGGLSGPNPLAVKATEGLNDDWIKNSYRPTMDTAKSADAILNRVGGLQRSGYMDSTGWGSTQKLYAANVLAAFGVKDAANYAGDAQTFRKFMMDANWELLNQAKGVQTEGDAQRALQTFAQLENTPRANRFILDFTSATAKLAKDKAAFFSRELQRNKGSGDLSAIEAAWQQNAPSVWDYPELKGRWGDTQERAANLGPRSVELPGGRVATFPSEAAARAFKQQMERR